MPATVVQAKESTENRRSGSRYVDRARQYGLKVRYIELCSNSCAHALTCEVGFFVKCETK